MLAALPLRTHCVELQAATDLARLVPHQRHMQPHTPNTLDTLDTRTHTHTHTHRALLHATARMISGGPVYVSDAPGRHNAALLRSLALPNGQLLQPLLPGRPCASCLFADVCGDGASLLKVWSLNACGGVVAVFNVQVRGRHDSASVRVSPGMRRPAAVCCRPLQGSCWRAQARQQSSDGRRRRA
jgi:raffinose synthase